MRKIDIKEEMDVQARTLIFPTLVEQAELEVGAGYIPARVLEIELGEPLSPLSALDEKTGRYYRRARCLIRLHGQPLGLLDFQIAGGEIQPRDYALQIWNTLGAQINEHLQRDGLQPVTGLNPCGLISTGIPRCVEEREQFLADAPFVSVVVATHNRPETLRHCLDSLLALRYPHYEIIVVDNAPVTTATADMIEQDYGHTGLVRYLLEERPGASRARNRAIMAARGEILAFSDDDVIVDSYWLVELVRAFRLENDVACVTGLLLPLELETRAQSWLEEYGGFSKGFGRRVFDLRENHPGTPLHPYTAGQFGSGASMAFTAAFLRSVGGFDPALGPGTQAQGGEDLSLFFQAVIQGHQLVYEPASVAYHLHRRGYVDLQKQIHSYGIGLMAYLMKNIVDNPRLVLDFVTRIPYGLYFILSARSSKNRKKSADYPEELTKLELKGMLYGPRAYMRSRRSIRSVGRRSVLSESRTVLSMEKEI
jgi:GT2 family glycosyltransferase